MHPHHTLALAATLGLGACGDSLTQPPGPPPLPSAELGCEDVTTVRLAPGQSVVLSGAQSAGCVRFPAGTDLRDYLAVAYSAAGGVESAGISGGFRWRSRRAVPAVASAAAAVATGPDGATRFHALLRARERALTPRSPVPIVAASPGVGEQRSFAVCSDISCAGFKSVPATAAFVGRRTALYLDDALPPGGFTPAEVERIGRLLDDHLYPLDTTAFGRESDIDGNGVVLVVITPAVNQLCFSAGGVVTGYFYGLDLDPSRPGSNGGEVLYAAAPDPGGPPGCQVTRQTLERSLPGTLVHELQHLISFNQHVLVRGGPTEHDWMNEGLSHLAEELAGRQVPPGQCAANDCLSQFVLNDVSNAYQYLFDTERWHLVMPETSIGRSAERGAAWLLLRWVVDHHGGAAAWTRSLVETGLVGATNLAAATGRSFGDLLGEWHLANYLDDLPGFVPVNERLRYLSWNWRVSFSSLHAQQPTLYPRPYPLLPDNSTGAYDRDGTLRGGSGRSLVVRVTSGGLPIDLRLTDPAKDDPLPPFLETRVAIARIR